MLGDQDGEVVTDFPQRLRELRTRKGISQEKLARRIDVSLGTVENWENGRTEPQLTNVGRLLDALETDFWTLVGRWPVPPQDGAG